jgi:glycosyltransferase involved in cell wall biosynthesis
MHMRILHVVPTYLPAVRYGGPIYSVHALCRALAAAGHEVNVFTTSVDGIGNSAVPHNRPVDLDGVQINYFQSRWLRRIYYSAGLADALSATIGAFEVAHLHSVYLFPTWAGARSSAQSGVPYVMSPRGMLDRELIAQRGMFRKRAWIRLVERGNLARASCIHVTSAEERRALNDLGLALAPISIIYNGVEAPISFSASAISADVRAVVADGFDVLYLGRITWKKGLDRLIRALARIPFARAVIAGNDEEGFVGKLRKLASQTGVGDRVRFLPRQITGPDKEVLFSAARLFVLPSVSENFGNVVAEAMIRKLPVIVTERVGAAEVVEASGGGIVAQIDQDRFNFALAEALRSPARLAVMGAAGETYVRARLTWENIARSFEDLYREVLTGRGAVRQPLRQVALPP